MDRFVRQSDLSEVMHIYWIPAFAGMTAWLACIQQSSVNLGFALYP